MSNLDEIVNKFKIKQRFSGKNNPNGLLREKDIQQICEAWAQAFSKDFTSEELLIIFTFCDTELGKKIIESQMYASEKITDIVNLMLIKSRYQT
jgi:hypothetical protein